MTSSASLSAVPDPYRTEFRDTSVYTHRYIDGNVVRIDTRTAVVANIYNVQYGG